MLEPEEDDSDSSQCFPTVGLLMNSCRHVLGRFTFDCNEKSLHMSRWSFVEHAFSFRIPLPGTTRHFVCKAYPSLNNTAYRVFFFFCQYIFYKDGQIANRS